MEAADSTARHSGISATSSEQQRHHHQPPHFPPYGVSRDLQDNRQYREHPVMAAASILPQSAQQTPPSYSTGYRHPGSGPSINNMISSVEPRKPSDDKDASSRQSLPSLSEVISGTKPSPYPHPAGHPLQPSSTLPSPFAVGPRPYPDSEKRPSPQPLHPTSYPARQEPLPPFTSSPRPSPFTGLPSLPAVGDRRSSPGAKPEVLPHRLVSDSQKPPEPHGVNGAYAHQPSQQSHAPPPPQAPPSYPPGQLPFPPYSMSPRHPATAHPPGQYDPRGPPPSQPPPAHPEDAEYGARARFDGQPANRHFESWSYHEALTRIASSSRTVYNFAEAYMKIASEQNHPQPIPERLPTEREVQEIFANMELMKRSLEQVRETVQVSIQNERAREGAKAKGSYEEDPDVPMYADGMKPPYGMGEVKKRRGRAAPPGRCHSCNRIDTPEWRRGPDGARTLCNACGLHYAKLERKRQLEARSIRPKPEDRS